MVRRVNVRQAASLLGISEGAVRQRIARGSLASEKDGDGHVYVVLPESTRVDTDEETASDTQADNRLIEAMQDQIEFLRGQLEQERQANRENRRLLAAALERMPEIEASPEARQSAETASEDADKGTAPPGQQEHSQRRSWWRAFFGLE